MPEIETWSNMAEGIRPHLTNPMRDRAISIADLNRLALSRFEDFGSFKICGQGSFPKTFLFREQAAPREKRSDEFLTGLSGIGLVVCCA
ncbi:MAG TPA: hypothetical protein VKV15_13610 [Bryobacteraceae bacterium]|nr:hypothetical protein [Bryobacteraceae bacterium]